MQIFQTDSTISYTVKQFASSIQKFYSKIIIVTSCVNVYRLLQVRERLYLIRNSYAQISQFLKAGLAETSGITSSIKLY